eukprot:5130486-Prymnesium_polylepis.1
MSIIIMCGRMTSSPAPECRDPKRRGSARAARCANLIYFSSVSPCVPPNARTKLGRLNSGFPAKLAERTK